MDAARLTSKGYASSLRSRYPRSGWLLPVIRGVFRRPQHKPGLEDTEAPFRWQHVVVSLQAVLERPVVVGGRTAPELGGFAHYASSTGPREVHIYGDELVPGWLGEIPIETTLVFDNARKLFRAEPISRGLEALKSGMADDEAPNLTTIHSSLTWMHRGDGSWPIKFSTPKRAEHQSSGHAKYDIKYHLVRITN